MEDEEHLEAVISYLKSYPFPFKKEIIIKKGENWLQEIMFSLLIAKFTSSLIRREKELGEDGRIDFGVGDVGVEVKIFRSKADADRLFHEIVKYKQHFDKIIIPYINAGGVQNLSYELQLLQKEFPQVRDYFELRILKEGEIVSPAIQQQVNTIEKQSEGTGMKILRGIGKILTTMGENASRNLEGESMESLFGPLGEPSPIRSKKSKHKKNRKRKRSRSLEEQVENWDRSVSKQLENW